MKSYTSIHEPKDLLTYEFLTKSLGVKKYDETATYSKGALVYHEDATDTYLDSIFEANQDIATAESWTAAHWDTVDLETIINRSLRKYKNYIEYDGSTAKEVVHMDKCVIFSGDTDFNLGLVGNAWHGKNGTTSGSLEISTDKKNWTAWDYSPKAAIEQDNGKYEVYIRGKGNKDTADVDTPEFSTFTTSAPVNLVGKLDWIIDYTAVDPVCGCMACLFGDSTTIATSPAQIIDASGFVMSKNLDTTNGMNYLGMFLNCITLVAPPILPATTLADSCYYSMFNGCISLVTPPALPATTLTETCYSNMFENCSSLAVAPILPAKTLTSGCYTSMFCSCTSLTIPPTLPATTLADYCYYQMFGWCESLALAPKLPATDLNGCTECYSNMFHTCTALTTPPALPATQLAANCYDSMFDCCSALTTAPTLPATNLTSCVSCYAYMFRDCTSLTTPPTLPATQLAAKCYEYMFAGCTLLITTPELLATTLFENCYQHMFDGCTSLIAPCELPATDIVEYCYLSMFENCSGITWTTDTSATAYILPSSGTGVVPAGVTDWSSDMFAGNSGTLPGSETTPPQTGTPQINYTYYYVTPEDDTMYKYKNYIEYDGSTAKEVVHMDKCVIFTSSNTFNLQLTGNKWYGEGTLEYSTNKKDWTQYPNDGTATLPAPVKQANGKYELYLRGKGNTHTYSSGTTQFTSAAADRFDIIGNFDWLLDYTSSNVLCGKCDNLFDSTGVVDASGLVMSKNFSTTETLQYYELFRDCTSLTQAPQLPATTLNNYCYQKMFYGCKSLIIAPLLPAAQLAEGCYETMFANCTALITPPILLATTLAADCCTGMFSCCDSLATAPTLIAKTLGDKCCSYMFENCISLTTSPTLPATTLAPECYSGMFSGCHALTNPPALPATTLAEGCYSSMFSDCIALTTPPQLPAETLITDCYNGMFYGCTSLITPPSLPATTLANGCYQWMLGGCESLITTPELPVETLANGCYKYMFQGCTALTAPCELPATAMVEECYSSMFDGCTGITWTTDTSATPYRLPTTGAGTEATGWSDDMFSGNAGDLPEGSGTPLIDTTYYYVTPEDDTMYKYKNYIEYDGSTAKEVVHMDKCVIFSGDSAFNLGLVDNAWYGSDTSGNPGSLEISTDKKTWATWDYAAKAAVQQTNGKYEVYIRGKGNKDTGNYNVETMTGDASIFTTSAPVNLIGKLDWIIDYTAANPVCGNCALLFGDSTFAGTSPAQIIDASGFVMSKNLDTTNGMNYLGMFSGCTSLTTPPQLPATQLTDCCYYYMFFECSKLTTPPTLPATQLDMGCYSAMFYGCKALTTAPELPATTLTMGCYSAMFEGCESLTTPPVLPATTLTQSCYTAMFADCKALTITPELPATTVSAMAYTQMFSGCTSLTTAPELPATTLAPYCYTSMFRDCTALTAPCELPATTMAEECYNWMFHGCTGITWTTDTSATPYRLPSTGAGTIATHWSHQMFQDNSGTLPGSEAGGEGDGTPSINTTYYYNPQPEEFVRKGKEYMEVISGTAPITGFTVDANGVLSFTRSSIEYVTRIDKSVIFTSPNTFNLQLSGNAWHGDGTLEYSTDGLTWETYGTTNATTLPAPKLQDNGKYELYLRGKGNTYTSDETDYTQFTTDTADRINIIGKFDHLLDYSSTPTVKSVQYLFYETNIVDASELILPMNFGETSDGNCLYLFSQCEYLTGVPQLPATTLATGCYADMFANCASLTTPPELPATQLTPWCYYQMFCNCAALTTAPALPALTVPSGAYVQMFDGCTSLTTPPATLLATTIEIDNTLTVDGYGDGYEWMFCSCPLTTIPTTETYN